MRKQKKSTAKKEMFITAIFCCFTAFTFLCWAKTEHETNAEQCISNAVNHLLKKAVATAWKKIKNGSEAA